MVGVLSPLVENAADPSNPTEAVALTRRLAELFPHLYIELAYHHHPREKLINRGLVALAQRLDPWTWQDTWGYVQANAITGARRVLVCAGQFATDGDGHLVHGGDMRSQIGQTLDNLETVLQAAGFGLGDVVRLNYYTTDVDACIEAMAEFGGRL